MLTKRKHELERDDFIFKNEKKLHKNPFETEDSSIERNLYEFNRQFEELKQYITLFNRTSMKQKTYQNKQKMEIEKKVENKSPLTLISKNNSEQNTFHSENNTNTQKVIISEDFGKINNITK